MIANEQCNVKSRRCTGHVASKLELIEYPDNIMKFLSYRFYDTECSSPYISCFICIIVWNTMLLLLLLLKLIRTIIIQLFFFVNKSSDSVILSIKQMCEWYSKTCLQGTVVERIASDPGR